MLIRLNMAAAWHYTCLISALCVARLEAVDTTLLPRLTASHRHSIVAVFDELNETKGTGFVFGHDRFGRTLILTNQHVVDGGLIQLGLLDGSTIDDVEILGTSTSTDLAVLRCRVPTRLPAFTLAPAQYRADVDTPVVAIAASDIGPLQHTGTLRRIMDAEGDVDGEFYESSVFTVSGFSGGPVLAVNPATHESIVVGVTAMGTATTSLGPWISEVHAFLESLAASTQPVSAARSHQRGIHK